MRPKTGDSASEPEGPAQDDQQNQFDDLIGGDPPASDPEDPFGSIPLCSGQFLFGDRSSSTQNSSDSPLDNRD